MSFSARSLIKGPIYMINKISISKGGIGLIIEDVKAYITGMRYWIWKLQWLLCIFILLGIIIV